MRKLLSLLLAPALVLSCESLDPGVRDEVFYDVEGTEVGHEMIVLGDKLEDPYTVENMTRALASVYPTKAGDIILSPTDIYVRFLPRNQDEYELLATLCPDLLDHPVDYAIRRDGDYYQDPDIPEDEITWQYAVVDKNFVFPDGILYEILDHCFIADHDIITRAGGTEINWEEVERESFRLTGNESYLAPKTRSSIHPSGRITIVDDLYDPEPIGVKGVTVSCNIFVKFAHAFTDDEGYYEMSKTFTGNPRYRLLYKNVKGFGIGLNLILVPASFSTLGKNSPEGVDCCIDKHSNRSLFCRSVVNNAAYDYFESCKDDKAQMKAPPSNLRLWLFQLTDKSSSVMLQQGAVVDGSILESFLGEYMILLKMFLPDITLGLKGADNYAEIYGRAIHELAHASHYMAVGNPYWNRLIKYVLVSFVTSGWVVYGVGTEEDHGYCEVAETWAYYMQTKVYRDRYPEQARSFGTNYWFSPQIFTYLDERGINKYKLFASLSPDVTDRDILQARLLSLYPECKTIINQAFDRY
ncbi:MAG: hypothetical protein MJY50_01730 [Bacteroidales bacterium]|nr:hypothetical protein [Bacteroidales bacterium]